MKFVALLPFTCLLMLLASCQEPASFCPPATGTPQFIAAAPETLATPTSAPGPSQVQIGRKVIQVDKVVEGPLCNDAWSGTVYVTCNTQVYPWTEHPIFLKNCDLTIEPGTVVYVAYHNNTAYYNGCSCHISETPEP